MECPSCSLTNPPDAILCDCGFDFRTASTYSTTNEVIVKGIKMPFWSMVVFMLRFAIAAIPAMIIVKIILLICSLIGSIGDYNIDDY